MLLRPIRRVVTGHDAGGTLLVLVDGQFESRIA
jgi:hypothetical protein